MGGIERGASFLRSTMEGERERGENELPEEEEGEGKKELPVIAFQAGSAARG
jgi:hypothetical protein